MIYEDSISRALYRLSVLCSGGHRGHSQRLADIYKDSSFGFRIQAV